MEFYTEPLNNEVQWCDVGQMPGRAPFAPLDVSAERV